MAVNATVHFGTPPEFPKSISGRKLIGNRGGVFLMLTGSAWSLPDLSNANITTVLQGLSTAGFNGITCWGGGGYSIIDASWNPKYERKADSSNWWTGTAWASTLGTAWNAMDHIASETLRLGMVFNFSFCGGNASTGAMPDMVSATNLQLYNVGIAVATRYPYSSYPNIVWHFMIDDAHGTGSTQGARIKSLFDGINDTEGITTRPVRWMEPKASSRSTPSTSTPTVPPSPWKPATPRLRHPSVTVNHPTTGHRTPAHPMLGSGIGRRPSSWRVAA
jgi:hypothetical protein